MFSCSRFIAFELLLFIYDGSKVLQHVLDTLPVLLASGKNLLRRQDEAVSAGIAKLNGVRIFRTTILEAPVITATRRGSHDLTRISSLVFDTIAAADCLHSAVSQLGQSGFVIRASITVVAIGY